LEPGRSPPLPYPLITTDADPQRPGFSPNQAATYFGCFRVAFICYTSTQDFLRVLNFMTTFSGHDLSCIRGERLVFQGLNFAIEAGDALVLVGPNGSGKSSLLRVMAGLLKPATGQLAWNGEPVNDDPEEHRGRLHYVGHHDAIKPVLTVSENIAFWAGLHAGENDAEVAVEKALDILSIPHLAEIPGRFLSAGQKRRANLARIFAAPAPVWLLDEPTTALDKASIAKLEEALAEHRAGGGMVILSTHMDVALENPKTLDLAEFTVPLTPLEAGDMML